MNQASPSAVGFLLPLILISLLFLPPVARILRRTGHSSWWCLIAWLPFVNLIGLWILAYARWPAVDKN
jgi:uncharacterized membrane protein YhaH (DUF805 family)